MAAQATAGAQAGMRVAVIEEPSEPQPAPVAANGCHHQTPRRRVRSKAAVDLLHGAP